MNPEQTPQSIPQPAAPPPSPMPPAPQTPMQQPQFPQQPAPQMQPQAQPQSQLPQMQPQAVQTFVNPDITQAQVPQHHTNASNIVLQWLTYAFWGWTVLTMSVLVAIVLSNILGDAETGSAAIYVIAATIVLLPISLVCDIFYSKQEPEKKTGASSIVMVIHAVIFALFAIGSLIAAVFSIVSMFTSSSDPTSSQIALYSSIIIFILYVATFLRTLNPAKMPWIRRAFIIFMAVAVGVIAIFGIFGPAAHERATRNDRLIDSNLYSISSEISGYAEKNKKLPTDLNQLTLRDDAEKVVDDKLIRYEANTLPPSSASSSSSYNSYDNYSTSKTYYYKLCVNYKKEKKDKYSSSYSDRYEDGDGYTSYISTSSHPAGEYCYKVKTTGY